MGRAESCWKAVWRGVGCWRRPLTTTTIVVDPVGMVVLRRPAMIGGRRGGRRRRRSSPAENGDRPRQCIARKTGAPARRRQAQNREMQSPPRDASSRRPGPCRRARRPASKATASRVGDRAAAHESEHRGDGTKRDDEPELLHFWRGIDCFDLQGNRDLLNPVEGRVKRKRRRQEQCKQSPDAGPCLRIGPQTAHRSIKSFVPGFRRCLTLVSNCLACHVGLPEVSQAEYRVSHLWPSTFCVSKARMCACVRSRGGEARSCCSSPASKASCSAKRSPPKARSCSPRPASSALRASCRSDKAASIGAGKAATG